MANAATAKSPAQVFGLVFGVLYVVIGILGFFVADEFTGGSVDDKLILFPVNHLHNVVHLAIGAVLLAGSRTALMARTVDTVVGVAYLAVAALGFTGIELVHTLLNIHSTGSADNFLHLVSGAAALYFGLASGRAASTS